ncbi:unnamed protein product [Oikopleura dioica]|uniref:Uncharacterized protein n=1 Tax=Oikopleura dioica TaxID=34765 RepID=E4Y1D2_OIKDI|nr:unnamed protein product [Oikopleura dioica]
MSQVKLYLSTAQLDRKIKALSNLRSQWSDTESQLHELSKELEANEHEYAQLDAQSKADAETREVWYQQLTEFEAKLPLFEPRLRKCDDSIVQLESHTEPDSSLKTRAANLRARFETLSDASKTLLSLRSELVSAGQRIRNNFVTIRGNLNAAAEILRVVEESEISQADEIAPLKEENNRAGLLIDSRFGILSSFPP